MDFRFSAAVDPSTYETDGLCDGYSLRIHKDQELVDLGTLRAQEDWRELVGPVGVFKGGLGAEYDFVTLAVPECLPERIEIIAYINEMIFLHDDIVEAVDKRQGDELNNVLVEGFLPVVGKPALDAECGRRQIQRKLVQKMVAIDREPALKTMAMWAEFLATGAGRRNHTRFDNLDEFMEYRILDVGKMYWVGVLTFGMGLTIPEDEMKVCAELCHPAWLSCGLINDLYSWPKEHRAFVENGASHVNNSVWVIMQEHSVDEPEAIQRLRGKIKACLAQFLETLEQNRERAELSTDLRRFMDALQYSMIANVVWSRSCPRYNEGREFNERQLRWMEFGTPGSPGIMGSEKTGRNQRDPGRLDTPGNDLERATRARATVAD